MTGGIAATHGKLGKSAIEAVINIVGEIDCLISVSNDGLSLNQIEKILSDAISQLSDCTDTIIFVGLRGGSLWNVANRISKNNPKIYVISGLNLPMLISFITKRNDLTIDELLDVIKKDAIRDIQS